MEYKKVQDECANCLKLEQIEEFLEQNSGKEYALLLSDWQNLYEVYRVSTTNSAVLLHVGAHIGYAGQNSITLSQHYSNGTLARKLIDKVVRNGKSVYLTDGVRVNDVAYWTVGADTIVLFLNNLVGELVDDRKNIEHTKDHINNENTWFNYN